MSRTVRAELKRELGFWSASSIVVGTIIGSGIFLVPASMVRNVGSPGMVLLVWVVGGLLSLAGALAYAELAAAFPRAGAEYVYLREAYGPLWGFAYSWMMTWVGKSGAIATLATGFTYYLATFVPALDDVVYRLDLPLGPGGGPLEWTYGQLVAAVLILLVGVINYLGVRLGARVQVAVTAAKVGSIAAIVAVGLFWPGGSWEHFLRPLPASGGLAGFFAALVGALWAYDGWNNVAMVAAETHQPARVLPKALVGGTLLVVAIYLAANLAYFYVLPAAEVAASDRVAATMMAKILGPVGAALVSVAAMLSMFGALNGSLLSGARIPYAAARGGVFFEFAAEVHPRFCTPGNAILLLTVWAALLVFTGRYEQLFTYVIFAEWLFYGMAAAGVIVLRRKHPQLDRPFEVPGYPWVPLVFVLVTAVLVGTTLVHSPRESILGLLLTCLGLPFYGFWRWRSARGAGKDRTWAPEGYPDV